MFNIMYNKGSFPLLKSIVVQGSGLNELIENEPETSENLLFLNRVTFQGNKSRRQ